MKAIFCPLPKSESLWVAGYFKSIFTIKDFALPFHTGGKEEKKYEVKEIWNQKIKDNLGNFISVSIWMFSFSCFYLLVFSFLEF